MANTTDDHRRIARHLDRFGPTPGDDLALALGLSPNWFWQVINHPWFVITGTGWALSDRGREEALTTDK